MIFYRKLDHDSSLPILSILFRDLTDVVDKNGGLINYSWINIPLVYTQLVQIAVHMYFFLTLFSCQVQEGGFGR